MRYKKLTKKFKFIIVNFVFILFSVFFCIDVNAKVQLTIDRTYEITEDYEMKVNEVRTVENKSENLYIPATEKLEFSILAFKLDEENTDTLLQEAVKSLVAKKNGNEISTKGRFTIEGAIARMSIPYGRDVLTGDKIVYEFDYIHPGLVYRNGVLVDAFIHAFDEETAFSTANSEVIYNTKLRVPKKINKEKHFILPEPIGKEDNDNYTIYNFSQKDLLGQFVWLQLGTYQVYDFKITQSIFATENKLTGLKNKFELILPTNLEGGEVEQNVYFKSITPEPYAVFRDEENNLKAEFRFLSNENREVTIEGYALVERIQDINLEERAGSLGDLSSELVNKYTNPGEFWEVDSQPIREKAYELKANRNNVFDIALETYDYIVDAIDYSEVKRFGLNERQGALRTLQGGAAVCMEYSDLYLTLMRANGIPSRAVFGYGYDPRLSGSEQEPHQWVQVYIPGMDRWVDVEVTWGESGDTLIGGDLNHFYTHTAFQNPNEPAMISRYAYGERANLEAPKFDIETVDLALESFEELKSGEDLINQYPKEEESEVDFYMDQILGRLEAGVMSLKFGLDLDNGSQVMILAIGGLILAILTFVLNKILKALSRTAKN